MSQISTQQDLLNQVSGARPQQGGSPQALLFAEALSAGLSGRAPNFMGAIQYLQNQNTDNNLRQIQVQSDLISAAILDKTRQDMAKLDQIYKTEQTKVLLNEEERNAQQHLLNLNRLREQIIGEQAQTAADVARKQAIDLGIEQAKELHPLDVAQETAKVTQEQEKVFQEKNKSLLSEAEIQTILSLPESLQKDIILKRGGTKTLNEMREANLKANIRLQEYKQNPRSAKLDMLNDLEALKCKKLDNQKKRMSLNSITNVLKTEFPNDPEIGLADQLFQHGTPEQKLDAAEIYRRRIDVIGESKNYQAANSIFWNIADSVEYNHTIDDTKPLKDNLTKAGKKEFEKQIQSLAPEILKILDPIDRIKFMQKVQQETDIVLHESGQIIPQESTINKVFQAINPTIIGRKSSGLAQQPTATQAAIMEKIFPKIKDQKPIDIFAQGRKFIENLPFIHNDKEQRLIARYKQIEKEAMEISKKIQERLRNEPTNK